LTGERVPSLGQKGILRAEPPAPLCGPGGGTSSACLLSELHFAIQPICLVLVDVLRVQSAPGLPSVDRPLAPTLPAFVLRCPCLCGVRCPWGQSSEMGWRELCEHTWFTHVPGLSTAGEFACHLSRLPEVIPRSPSGLGTPWSRKRDRPRSSQAPWGLS
jgi:hypothetical protein